MITEVIWKIQNATCSSEIVVNFGWQKQSQVYSGAPNVSFLQNMFKILFRLSRVSLDLEKYILSSATKFLSVRSS